MLPVPSGDEAPGACKASVDIPAIWPVCAAVEGGMLLPISMGAWLIDMVGVMLAGVGAVLLPTINNHCQSKV